MLLRGRILSATYAVFPERGPLAMTLSKSSSIDDVYSSSKLLTADSASLCRLLSETLALVVAFPAAPA